MKMKIILSAAVLVLLFGCSEDKTAQQAKTEVSEMKVVSQKVEKPVEKVQKIQEVQEKTEPKVSEKKEVVETKTQEVEKVLVPTLVNAEELYKKSCATCHGAHAEKKALTKSQVIQGWDVAKIENALFGYQNKTYGAGMKSIMEGKTKTLSEAEIKALAEYIAGM